MQSIINKKSSALLEDGSPKLPDPSIMHYGELAINYHAGVESLAIKNSNDEIVSISLSGLKNVQESLKAHEERTDNPHEVTKAQVGLGNVDNTADLDKPVSILQQAELDKKLNNAANGGIADNLTTNSSEIALSAAQGIALNNRLNDISGGAIEDLQALEQRVASVEEEISGSTNYIDTILMPLAVEINSNYSI